MIEIIIMITIIILVTIACTLWLFGVIITAPIVAFQNQRREPISTVASWSAQICILAMLFNYFFWNSWAADTLGFSPPDTILISILPPISVLMSTLLGLYYSVYSFDFAAPVLIAILISSVIIFRAIAKLENRWRHFSLSAAGVWILIVTFPALEWRSQTEMCRAAASIGTDEIKRLPIYSFFGRRTHADAKQTAQGYYVSTHATIIVSGKAYMWSYGENDFVLFGSDLFLSSDGKGSNRGDTYYCNN